ncbi:MAG: hypothetical protein ACOY5B_08445 [Spirochaetota bacterium]
MQLRRNGEDEILDGHYDRRESVRNVHEVLVDGETGNPHYPPAIGKGEPAYIVIVKDHEETTEYIYPSQSPKYTLLKTTERGFRNLKQDKFNFVENEVNIVPVAELTEIDDDRRMIP